MELQRNIFSYKTKTKSMQYKLTNMIEKYLLPFAVVKNFHLIVIQILVPNSIKTYLKNSATLNLPNFYELRNTSMNSGGNNNILRFSIGLVNSFKYKLFTSNN